MIKLIDKELARLLRNLKGLEALQMWSDLCIIRNVRTADNIVSVSESVADFHLHP